MIMKKLILFFWIGVFSFSIGKADLTTIKYTTNDELSIREKHINRLAGAESVSWSPDSSLLSISGEYYAVVYDISKKKNIATLDNQKGIVAWSKTGKYLFNNKGEGYLNIWSSKNGDLVNRILVGNQFKFHMAFSPDDKYFVIGNTTSIDIYEMDSGIKFESISVERGQSYYKVEWSNDGNFIVCSNLWGSELFIIDLKNQMSISRIRFPSHIKTFEISPNSNFIAVSDEDNAINIYSIETQSKIKELRSHKESINSLSWSPNEKYLASGSYDTNVKIWDIENSKVITTLSNNNTIEDVEWSFSGENIASIDRDRNLRVWGTKPVIQKVRLISDSPLYNDKKEIESMIPANLVVDIDINSKKIFMPLSGYIDTKNYETLYSNPKDTMIVAMRDILVYLNPNKGNLNSIIEKGKVIDTMYYSSKTGFAYVEVGDLKGWIELKDLEIFNKIKKKRVTFLEKNKTSLKDIKSSELVIFETEYIDTLKKNYYIDGVGIKPISNITEIKDIDKELIIYAIDGENNFYSKENINIVNSFKIGTRFFLNGEMNGFYLVINEQTGEKFWVEKNKVSLKKPDLIKSMINIEDINASKNGIVQIKGIIKDDNVIKKFLVNGVQMSISEKSIISGEYSYEFNIKTFLNKGIKSVLKLEAISANEEKAYIEISFDEDLEVLEIRGSK